MRPVTDLCWTSQKNNNLMKKTANLVEAEKVEAIRMQRMLYCLYNPIIVCLTRANAVQEC